MIPGRTVGEDRIAQNQFNNVGRSESLALNGESADRPSQDLETEDIHSTLEPGKTSSMTRRGFVASAVATFLAGCGSNNDQTGTEREGVDTPQTETAYPMGESTEPEDAPTAEDTQEDTPDDDDIFENMTAYEQAVNDLWSREGVNENFADEHQRMLDEGNRKDNPEKIGKAIEGAMKQGAQEGLARPVAYQDEGDYLESGPVHSIAKSVELYGEEDPDNTQEALGLHRLNVDVKRVLLDGQEADVAIVEDTQADETVLATNINLAPGTEGPNADAYRVGTEAQGTTQELLKGLIDADDMGNANNFDWETWRNAVERTNNYDPEANARTMSRYFGDIVAGASLSHDDVIGGSVDPQHPMLLTEQFQQQLSEGPTTGLIEGTRKATQKVAETDRDESEIYVLGKDYNVIACEYDFSQGIPETLEDISS